MSNFPKCSAKEDIEPRLRSESVLYVLLLLSWHVGSLHAFARWLLLLPSCGFSFSWFFVVMEVRRSIVDWPLGCAILLLLPVLWLYCMDPALSLLLLLDWLPIEEEEAPFLLLSFILLLMPPLLLFDSLRLPWKLLVAVLVVGEVSLLLLLLSWRFRLESCWEAKRRRETVFEHGLVVLFGFCPRMVLSQPASLFFWMFCSKMARADRSLLEAIVVVVMCVVGTCSLCWCRWREEMTPRWKGERLS